MISANDFRAAVRILALYIAEKYGGDTEELLEWAYKAEEEEKVTIESAERDVIDYASVFMLWNNTMVRNIPRITKMTPGRKEKVRQRVSEMGGWKEAKNVIPECFKKINASDFCNGSTGWTASFDWFFANDKNWTKVLEGNYDNRRGKTAFEQMQEEIAKADAYYEQRYGAAGPYGNPAGGWGNGTDEQ